jgi:NTP pyrophosphatase (non-canonical NTP hydrolase)
MTELASLQNKVLNFVKKNKIETQVESRLLDLSSEIGELSKEVLKGSDYGSKKFVNTDEWVNEFGDVFFSLICLANRTEVDLERPLEKALDKYRERTNYKGDISSGE